MPSPLGGCHAVIVPGAGAKLFAGSSALMRHSITWPLERDVALLSTCSGWPAAISICAITRSLPLRSSLTVCSTWRRQFISMNRSVAAVEQHLHRARADVADRRGGTRGGLADAARADRPMSAGDGLSSISFW